MRNSRVGSTEQRFFSRFVVDPVSGCWNWTGPPTSWGYGMISGEIGGKRYGPKGARMLAHRVSWIIHYGDIPEGEGAHGTIVMHTCDNRLCVNPAHLRLGTQAENVADMHAKGRRKYEGLPSGVKHHHAAIKDVESIALIRSSSSRQTGELAKKFNVHRSTIRRIRKNDSWALTEPKE